MQRTRSMVMTESGVLAAVSIIRDTIKNVHPPPIQIILALGERKRAYSRDRLAKLFHHELVHVFRSDFDPSLKLSNCELYMTFHGAISGDPPVLIDGNSWKDLLQHVTKIELRQLRTTRITRGQLILFSVIMFFIFLFFLVLLDDVEYKASKSKGSGPRFTRNNQAYY